MAACFGWLPRQLDIDNLGDDELTRDHHDLQPDSQKMPRLPHTLPGHPQGAWQKRRNPLCLRVLHFAVESAHPLGQPDLATASIKNMHVVRQIDLTCHRIFRIMIALHIEHPHTPSPQAIELTVKMGSRARAALGAVKRITANQQGRHIFRESRTHNPREGRAWPCAPALSDPRQAGQAISIANRDARPQCEGS